ncbi:hypothetical protein [Hymenobacter siberiensis]|uniref:hypothetical protein n=1 Tax=Hymenobacter siberiensis TaxID=2848396 RepID=UPI001C1E22F5|nr:hypothetical protein [Hymenobacter siberiensis]MBU6122615.1 hypothetical protein [Hymenobacter siberiensis]
MFKKSSSVLGEDFLCVLGEAFKTPAPDFMQQLRRSAGKAVAHRNQSRFSKRCGISCFVSAGTIEAA